MRYSDTPRSMRVRKCCGAIAAAIAVGNIVPGARADLIRHWPFDGSPDELVAGDDGIVVGNPSYAPDNVDNPDSAIAVDGSLAEHVRVEGGGGLNDLQTGTIAFWVKWSGLQSSGFGGATGVVFSRQGNNVFNNQLILLDGQDPAAAVVQWVPYGPFTIETPLVGTTVVGDDTWRHVAVTYASGGDHKLYVDGSLDASAPYTGTIVDDPSVPLAIGAWIDHGGTYSTSMIDDVKVFDTILSEAEIGDLVSSGPPAAFAITDVVFVGGGSPSVRITFNSRPGRNYAIDYATVLQGSGQPGGWVELTDSVSSDGASTEFVDTFVVGQGFPELFYRVRDTSVQPSP